MKVFELFGEILIKDNGASETVDKLDKKGASLGKTFGTLGVGVLAAGAAITGAFGAALVMGIQGVKDGEDATAQLDAVLKSTGGSAGVTRQSLLDMADKMQLTTKFTQEQTLAAESLLLTFTNIGSETFPRATQAAADMATALGTDMAGQSIALGKALNDPTKGITALTRVGVTFTEEQKKSIKAMQESGDMAGAQTVILKELEKEFGGSAEAAGKTFSGQLAILKNAFGEVTEQLAMNFMPYLQKFMDFVMKNMPAIQNFFTVAFDVIGKAVTTVWGIIQNNLIPAFKAVWEWIQPYMPQIKQMVSDAFNTVKAVMKVVGDYIVNFVIPTYKAMADWFFKNFPAIKAAVEAAYNYIKPSFDNLVKVVKENLIPIIQDLWTKVEAAMPTIQRIFQAVFPLVVAAIKLGIDIIAAFIGVVKGVYDAISPPLNLVIGIFDKVSKAIEAAIGWLKNWNGTPANDKTATTTLTTYTKQLTGNSAGTDNWRGGLTRVNEEGGEIMDLPSGTRIIPHDVSMEMARNTNSNKNNGGFNLTIGTFINNTKSDIEELAQELQFYMNQKNLGTGGST